MERTWFLPQYIACRLTKLSFRTWIPLISYKHGLLAVKAKGYLFHVEAGWVWNALRCFSLHSAAVCYYVWPVFAFSVFCWLQRVLETRKQIIFQHSHLKNSLWTPLKTWISTMFLSYRVCVMYVVGACNLINEVHWFDLLCSMKLLRWGSREEKGTVRCYPMSDLPTSDGAIEWDWKWKSEFFFFKILFNDNIYIPAGKD